MPDMAGTSPNFEEASISATHCSLRSKSCQQLSSASAEDTTLAEVNKSYVVISSIEPPRGRRNLNQRQSQWPYGK